VLAALRAVIRIICEILLHLLQQQAVLVLLQPQHAALPIETRHIPF